MFPPSPLGQPHPGFGAPQVLSQLPQVSPQMAQAILGGASLNPFSGRPDPSDPNVVWAQTPIGPRPWLPYANDNSIGFFERWYVMTPTVSNGTAGTEVVRDLKIDIPGHVVAITGAAVTTDDSDLPNGRSSLDTFLIRLDHSQGDKLITQAVLGSAAVGTAQFPAYVDMNGWKFGNGATIYFGITPLMANLRVDVLIKFLEIRRGANFG